MKGIKVAFKRASRFRIFLPHLKSSQFHEPSRSCDRWILFHIENSFWTWPQSSLTDTNKMTKMAFKEASRLRIFFFLIKNGADSMSLAGAAIAEHYFALRFPLGREHGVHYRIQKRPIRWLLKKRSASRSFRLMWSRANSMSLAKAAIAEYYFTSKIHLGREHRVH